MSSLLCICILLVVLPVQCTRYLSCANKNNNLNIIFYFKIIYDLFVNIITSHEKNKKIDDYFTFFYHSL